MVVITLIGSSKWNSILIVILSSFRTLLEKVGNHPKPRLMVLKPKLIETIGILSNKKAITKTKRAMITLVSSMTRDEGVKLQHYSSAKEMWQTLENHYEGNVQVKSKKVQLHMYEYELFKMKPHETITDMTNRLNALVTTFKKLGKPFTKEEVNNKILRILPKKNWESRVASIEEA